MIININLLFLRLFEKKNYETMIHINNKIIYFWKEPFRWLNVNKVSINHFSSISIRDNLFLKKKREKKNFQGNLSNLFILSATSNYSPFLRHFSQLIICVSIFSFLSFLFFCFFCFFFLLYFLFILTRKTIVFGYLYLLDTFPPFCLFIFL